MNGSFVRKLIQVSVLLVFILLLLPVYSFATKTTVNVTIEGNLDPVKLNVTVDDEPLSLINSETLTYRAKIGQGQHKLVVSAADYTTSTTKFDSFIRSTKNFNVSLSRASAEEIAEEIYETDDGLDIVNPKLFGSNDWLVFSLSQIDGNGGVAVARLDASTGKWIIITEGTDIDPSTPGLEDAPLDLVNYLRTGL